MKKQSNQLMYLNSISLLFLFMSFITQVLGQQVIYFEDFSNESCGDQSGSSQGGSWFSSCGPNASIPSGCNTSAPFCGVNSNFSDFETRNTNPTVNTSDISIPSNLYSQVDMSVEVDNVSNIPSFANCITATYSISGGPSNPMFPVSTFCGTQINAFGSFSASYVPTNTNQTLTIEVDISNSSASPFVIRSIQVDVILFADIIDFEILPTKNKVEIYWETSSEQQNDYFIVEKSLNAQSFQSIGTIEGAGNSNVKQFYHFTDRSPTKGTSYYRIKSVDYSERIKATPIKAIHLEQQLENSFSIFPTAVSDYLNLIINDSNIFYSDNLWVYNQVGQIMINDEISLGESTNETRLDVTILPPGNYFIRIGEEVQQFVKL